MSALASSGWESTRQDAQATHATGNSEGMIHERISAVRDTLLVLGLQLVFRVTLIMRRWNY
jgi:hypothetical protein